MLTAYPLPNGDRAHWNYFLGLENMLENATRFVEFNIENKDTYSIEFAQILMSSSAEIDVLAKLILSIIEPEASRPNIDDYREVITSRLPVFAQYYVIAPPFGLRIQPWASWKDRKNPDWWRKYNNVKHERDKFFKEATLENAMTSMAALLVTIIQYYRLRLAPLGQVEQKMGTTTSYLYPESKLLRLDGDFYAGVLSLSPD